MFSSRHLLAQSSSEFIDNVYTEADDIFVIERVSQSANQITPILGRVREHVHVHTSEWPLSVSAK